MFRHADSRRRRALADLYVATSGRIGRRLRDNAVGQRVGFPHSDGRGPVGRPVWCDGGDHSGRTAERSLAGQSSGVHGDEPAADIERFLTTTPIPYAIALDPGAKTNGGFIVNALPTLVVVDRKGIIREVFIGSDDAAKVEATILPLLAE